MKVLNIMLALRSYSGVIFAFVATALVGCGGGSTGGTVSVTPMPTFNAASNFAGIADNAVTGVTSTNLTFPNSGIADTRFTVEFTSGGELVVTDTLNNRAMTVESNDVVSSFQPVTIMKAFESKARVGDFSAIDPTGNYEVTVITPAAANGGEYALVRTQYYTNSGGDTDTNWMLVGEATAATLSGSATYSGGYQSTVGLGAMELAANFGSGVVGVTLHAPAGDPGALGGGISSVSFDAAFDDSDNTIKATAAPITDPMSYFNAANMDGVMLSNGNASAGIIHLESSSVFLDDLTGAYHVKKD